MGRSGFARPVIPMFRVVRLATVAAACVGLSVGVAAASTSETSDSSVSPNWSGYAATSPAGSPVSFTTVSGTWKVPVAKCAAKDAGAVATVWVGLGGYGGGPRTEEAGTNSSCSAKGKPIYWAWFELVPYPATTIEKMVAPGDTITGSVRILDEGLGVAQVQIQNQTRGWIFTRKLSVSQPDTSSAEWIVSAPATCVRFDCKQASLANFGQAGMTGISAVGNSRPGTLASTAWKVVPIQLVPSVLNVPTMNPDAPSGDRGRALSPAGANPGPVSNDGSAFKVQWVAVAKRGL
jgi:hypothetical protein